LRDEHLSVVLATRRRLARVVAVVSARDARPCGRSPRPATHRHQLEDAAAESAAAVGKAVLDGVEPLLQGLEVARPVCLR